MTHQSAKRGFNLVEAAIVLGVIGLVIGGIWVAAASVQSNLRKTNAMTGLIQIATNTANLLKNHAYPAGPQIDITTQMISAGALPGNFVDGTAGVNPFGGAVFVYIPNAASPQIRVQFRSVPRDACIEFTTRAILNGLASLTVNSNLYSTFPVTLLAATNACTTGPNTLSWNFNR